MILFLSSTILGYLIAERFPINILEMLREIFGDTGEFNPLWLMIFIFLNNSVKSLLVILLGFFFGIFPFLFITINGLMIGLIIFETGRTYGVPFVLASILPHGVLEIPLIALSTAIGIRIGYEMMRKVGSRGSIRAETMRGIRVFALIILPLLLLSAMVEAFLTPLIMKFFL